ncbi:hypothetical protein NGM37_26150, partial [Streptomyces sp. TRM76130]|nr:hypothetical protein [Streptomyces sp. TRM76130]
MAVTAVTAEKLTADGPAVGRGVWIDRVGAKGASRPRAPHADAGAAGAEEAVRDGLEIPEGAGRTATATAAEVVAVTAG